MRAILNQLQHRFHAAHRPKARVSGELHAVRRNPAKPTIAIQIKHAVDPLPKADSDESYALWITSRHFLGLLPAVTAAVEAFYRLSQHHVSRQDNHQQWEVAQRQRLQVEVRLAEKSFA